MKAIVNFFLVFLLLNSGVYAEQKPVIKIGVVTPLSGNMAHIGKSFQNGATLALEELAKRNGRYRFEVVFEDNAFDSKKSALAAQKLIGTNKVDVLLSTWDACGLVVAPLAEKHQIIHFGTAWTDRVLVGPYNFNMATPPTEQARQLGVELKKRRHTKLGMLHDTNNAAQEIREAFDRVLPQYGVTVVAEERFTSQERDFRTLLAKLKAYAPQPDILYIGGFSPQLEIIGRQFAQMGHWSETRAYKDTVKHGRVAVSTRIKPPLTTCECFDETQEKQVFEGCWYVAPAMPDEEALQQYKKRFGMQMIGSVALAYNVVMLTAQAYETAPSEEIPPSHATVAQILRETKEFKGLASTVTNDGRGFFVAPAVTKVIRDGKAVVEK